MDTIQWLLTCLPSAIEYEGCSFNLEIFKNGTREMRLCYNLQGVSEGSRHYSTYKETGSWVNPLTDSLCDFLYLQEGIEFDGDLSIAVDRAFCFLVKHGLTPPNPKFTGGGFSTTVTISRTVQPGKFWLELVTSNWIAYTGFANEYRGFDQDSDYREWQPDRSDLEHFAACAIEDYRGMRREG